MFLPSIVSEREAGGWEDCTPCSGVMFANGCAGANVHPATRDEYEGLRFDATGVREGNGDGMNLRELEDGLRIRYGLRVIRGGGWPALLAAAPIGSYLVIQGDTRGLPSRLQFAYRGPHCVAGARVTGLALGWGDPLRENGRSMVTATLEEARAFYETLPGAEWIVSTAERRTGDVAISRRPELGDVAQGVPFYDAPGGQEVGRFSKATTVTVVGVPMDGSHDHLNLGWRAVDAVTSAIDGTLGAKIVYVLVTALANMRPVPPPAAPPSDDLEAAALRGAAAEWDRWAAAVIPHDRPGSPDT